MLGSCNSLTLLHHTILPSSVLEDDATGSMHRSANEGTAQHNKIFSRCDRERVLYFPELLAYAVGSTLEEERIKGLLPCLAGDSPVESFLCICLWSNPSPVAGVSGASFEALPLLDGRSTDFD